MLRATTATLIETKNLKIETIEEVDGKTLRDHWKSPMFVVNGEYFASSIFEHNIHKKPFDLRVGEDVEVIIDEDNWIARS
jgi:protein subunit release factor B